MIRSFFATLRFEPGSEEKIWRSYQLNYPSALIKTKPGKILGKNSWVMFQWQTQMVEVKTQDKVKYLIN
jgi:hypothetical protein